MKRLIALVGIMGIGIGLSERALGFLDPALKEDELIVAVEAEAESPESFNAIAVRGIASIEALQREANLLKERCTAIPDRQKRPRGEYLADAAEKKMVDLEEKVVAEVNKTERIVRVDVNGMEETHIKLVRSVPSYRVWEAKERESLDQQFKTRVPILFLEAKRALLDGIGLIRAADTPQKICFAAQAFADFYVQAFRKQVLEAIGEMIRHGERDAGSGFEWKVK